MKDGKQRTFGIGISYLAEGLVLIAQIVALLGGFPFLSVCKNWKTTNAWLWPLYKRNVHDSLFFIRHLAYCPPAWLWHYPSSELFHLIFSSTVTARMTSRIDDHDHLGKVSSGRHENYLEWPKCSCEIYWRAQFGNVLVALTQSSSNMANMGVYQNQLFL